jgi:hypothetical protein
MANKNESMQLWDKQLAEEAQASAAQVAGLGGGSFFSVRGGTLKLGDAAIPNNEMGVIILDHVLENVFYGADFNPDNLVSPQCYAFGRDAGTMVPHEAAPKKVCDQGCKTCPNNAFGSAEKGRGKACKNRIRLACISGGTFTNGRFEALVSPSDVATAQVAYLSIPPTSIGAWGAYVKGLVSSLKRPPWAVFTKIKVQPDVRTQLSITFELLGPCPPSLAAALTKKAAEAKEAIIFPYLEREEQPKGKKRKRKF